MHDIVNLSIRDGSQFTTGGADNPSLKIVTLAIRQAGYLTEQLYKRAIRGGKIRARLNSWMHLALVGVRVRGSFHFSREQPSVASLLLAVLTYAPRVCTRLVPSVDRANRAQSCEKYKLGSARASKNRV